MDKSNQAPAAISIRGYLWEPRCKYLTRVCSDLTYPGDIQLLRYNKVTKISITSLFIRTCSIWHLFLEPGFDRVNFVWDLGSLLSFSDL